MSRFVEITTETTDHVAILDSDKKKKKELSRVLFAPPISLSRISRREYFSPLSASLPLPLFHSHCRIHIHIIYLNPTNDD